LEQFSAIAEKLRVMTVEAGADTGGVKESGECDRPQAAEEL
jgi:hypothetical protein